MKITPNNKNKVQKGEYVIGQDIPEGIFNIIKADFPDFDKNDYISITELYNYRRLYLTSLITHEKRELTFFDRSVNGAIKYNSIKNIQHVIEDELKRL